MNRCSMAVALTASALSISLTACGDDREAREMTQTQSAASDSQYSGDRSVEAATPGAGNEVSPNSANTPGGITTGQAGADARTSAGAGGAVGSSGSTTAPATGSSSGSTMSGSVPSNPSPGMAGQGSMGAAPGKEAAATVGTTERKFVDMAASSGLLELEAGRVVQERGSSPAVRELADKLVRDHATANEELKQLAARKNLTVPAQLKSDQQAEVDQLRKADARSLDRMYLQRIGLEHHRKDIAEFERTARESNDPDIRAFAEKTLPTLRQHRTEAQRVASAAPGK